MERIFVEGKPDKLLVLILGFVKNDVQRANNKSGVYHQLEKGKNLTGIVDQDPSADPGTVKYHYDNELDFVKEIHGMLLYKDLKRNNTVIKLKINLEDWIIETCKITKTDITKFGLPNNGKELHKVINYRMTTYEKLLNHLLEKENKALITLKEWLQQS